MNFLSKESKDSGEKPSTAPEKRYGTPQNPVSLLTSKLQLNSHHKRMTFDPKPKHQGSGDRVSDSKDSLANTQPLAQHNLYESVSRSLYDNPMNTTPRPRNPLRESASALPGIDLQQLHQLQMQIQSNPNIIQQTQNLISLSLSRSPNSLNAYKSGQGAHIGELEKALGELRIENERLRTQVKDLEFGLDSRGQELEAERQRAEATLAELEGCGELELRLEEAQLEVRRLKNDLDFHHRCHVELRKEKHTRGMGDFQLASLRRDLAFRGEEVEALKLRCQELQQSVEELMVYAGKPLNEKPGSAESHFARQIVELEATVRRMREERAELEATGKRSRRPSPRAPGSCKDLPPDDTATTLRFENDALRQRVETARKDNLLLRAELEKLRGQPEGPIRESPGLAQAQACLQDCQAQNELLQQDNQRLRLMAGAKPGGEPKTAELERQLAQLQKEKTPLADRVRSLEQEVAVKNKEIVRLQADTRDDNQETIHNLIEANKRMTVEITRLQEQIRKMESFSHDSMLGSLNRY